MRAEQIRLNIMLRHAKGKHENIQFNMKGNWQQALSLSENNPKKLHLTTRCSFILTNLDLVSGCAVTLVILNHLPHFTLTYRRL